LFGCSVIIIKWFQDNIQAGLIDDGSLEEGEYTMRVLSNFGENIDFQFQYLFAGNVICLIYRIIAML
jgi:hypothetical protein